MRILHITTRHVPGGAARNLEHVVEWERAQGHQVEVALGPASEGVAFPRDVSVHRVEHLRRDLDPAADPRALRELRRLIAERGFELVNTHQSKAGVLGRLAARGQSRLIAHTVHMASFGPGYPRPASLLFHSAERLCARFTTHFVTVGEELKQRYLSAGIGREGQYSIIRSPIGVDAFARIRSLGDPERDGLRRRFGIEPNRRVIAAAGLLEPRKRYALMLDQLAPLLATGRAILLIAGEGAEEDALKSQARRLLIEPAVRFMGFSRSLPELFAIADAFVHTSGAEGVPQVVLQAFAAGVPVVATRVEGLREIRSAPLTVVPRSGLGLLPATEAALLPPRRRPVDVDSLQPWTLPAIDVELARFHRRLACDR